MARSSIVGRDVVMVAVRYRLGIFGFLAHRGALQDGAAGNYGLMDQIAALRWVRANITRFGGDPSNITLAGESAGSQDVGLLLASRATRDLFAKAAMESGTPAFGLPVRPLGEALRLGDQVDALLGSGGDIARLRTASANALLAADLKLHDRRLTADDYLWLRPTIDGMVLTDGLAALLATAPPRPVLIGSNRFELDLPGGRPARDAFVGLSFGSKEAQARAYYRLDIPDAAPDPRMGTVDQQIATDATFRCPAGRMAQVLARSGAPVWRYEFDGAPGGGMTRHAIEIPYIFERQPIGGVQLQDYWVAFAQQGDPNAAGLPSWPRYEAIGQRHLTFDDRGATPGARLRTEACSLTEHL